MAFQKAKIDHFRERKLQCQQVGDTNLSSVFCHIFSQVTKKEILCLSSIVVWFPGYSSVSRFHTIPEDSKN